MLDFGLRVVLDPHLPNTERYQYRFPRSKRKRIRRKWSKDPRNWRTREVCTLLRIGMTPTIHCNVLGYQAIQRAIEDGAPLPPVVDPEAT